MLSPAGVVITLKDITMFNLANGMQGIYKNKKLKIHPVGRMSYVVVFDGHAARVSGIGGVKKYIKSTMRMAQ